MNKDSKEEKPQKRYCPSCGKAVPDGVRYCPYCQEDIGN